MGRTHIEGSSSARDGGPAAKRQKIWDTRNPAPLNLSSGGSSPESRRVNPNSAAESAIFHNISSATEVTNSQLNQIRRRMHTLCEAERRILMVREEVSKRVITELQFYLVGTSQVIQESRGAQAAAECRAIEEQQKNTELMNENTELRGMMFHQTSVDRSKLKAAANKITELQQKLDSRSTLLAEYDTKTIELERMKKKIAKLESEKISLRIRLQDLKKKLKLGNEEDADSSEEEGMTTECELSSPRRENEDRNGDESSGPNYIAELLQEILEEDGSSSCLQASDSDGAEKSVVETTNSESDNAIRVGELYVLPSHEKFFEIDWKIHYKQVNSRHFSCEECQYSTHTRLFMEDHIWAKHYGGRFKCPFCFNNLRRRHGIKQHVKHMHFDKLRIVNLS